VITSKTPKELRHAGGRIVKMKEKRSAGAKNEGFAFCKKKKYLLYE